jgi:uncharacterized protein (TIGR02246 family)
VAIRKAMIVVVVLCVTALSAAGQGGKLTAEDIAKIKKVHSDYEKAWLRGDPDGVRALFTEDCVLLPPHGDTPRVGQKGLNEYWFPPDAPATEITRLVVTPKSIGGDGEIAYVWGTDDVAWTTVQNGKKTEQSHTGIFLNVLRKQADGGWKLSHHMWDDALPKS